MMRASRSRWIRALAFCACLAQPFAAPAQAADVLVFAAASLKPALDEIIASPEARRIGDVSASYAASSQLARQIEHAAPAAIFISADPEWMDHVEQRGKLVPGTRGNLLGNALVLVAPRDSAVTLRIGPGFGLARTLGGEGRLAIGEPNSVPAGKYAKAALVALGVWADVEARLAPAVNVRAALSFVVRNETPLGIVYRSDAVSETAVRIVDAFPASTHPPIVYPVALIDGGDNAAARRMLDYLHSAEAAAVFTRYGFDRLAP